MQINLLTHVFNRGNDSTWKWFSTCFDNIQPKNEFFVLGSHKNDQKLWLDLSLSWSRGVGVTGGRGGGQRMLRGEWPLKRTSMTRWRTKKRERKEGKDDHSQGFYVKNFWNIFLEEMNYRSGWETKSVSKKGWKTMPCQPWSHFMKPVQSRSRGVGPEGGRGGNTLAEMWELLYHIPCTNRWQYVLLANQAHGISQLMEYKIIGLWGFSGRGGKAETIHRLID